MKAGAHYYYPRSNQDGDCTVNQMRYRGYNLTLGGRRIRELERGDEERVESVSDTLHLSEEAELADNARKSVHLLHVHSLAAVEALESGETHEEQRRRRCDSSAPPSEYFL